MTIEDQKRMMENAQAVGSLGDQRPRCLGTYGSNHGVPLACSPSFGCGLRGCPWQRPSPSAVPHVAADTVYAHVERTVHALLTTIDDACSRNSVNPGATADRVKLLAEAVQALSSWPQFNPMNAASEYQKLAEYEVQKAIRSALPPSWVWCGGCQRRGKCPISTCTNHKDAPR